MNHNATHHGNDGLAQYALEHQGTALGTGWFAPVPVGAMDFEMGLEYIRKCPNDEFLHKYLLNMAATFGPNLTSQLIGMGKGQNYHLLALMYEACVLHPRLKGLIKEFEGLDTRQLTQYTPLIYIRWSMQKDLDQKAYWIQALSDNILRHGAAIPPDQWKYPMPLDKKVLRGWKSKVVCLKDITADKTPKEGTKEEAGQAGIGAADTATRALARLNHMGLKCTKEMRNPASLSPFALQIQWHMLARVSMGRHNFQLTGLQTSYGKGLSVETARASCLMEVVERVSAFASFDAKRALHYKHPHDLVHGHFEDLRKSLNVLDPNAMCLEIPYENQALYWIQGERVDGQGSHPIYVPAQLVFLFCNLDETGLTSGMPSTGLASGNTVEEAKLHALLEVIERDAERVMPYVSDRCFCLKPGSPPVQQLLDCAAAQGIRIQILDITSELGVPCYKAFIQGPDGQLLKGCAAHLDGKRAVVSALLEMPYHASWFDPVHVPGLEGLKTTRQQDLPDYSVGDPALDLKRLERLLIANGYGPVYVDLTRKDLDIPVVKAIVPGLEMFADFDEFSNLSPRQFAHFFGCC